MGHWLLLAGKVRYLQRKLAQTAALLSSEEIWRNEGNGGQGEGEEERGKQISEGIGGVAELEEEEDEVIGTNGGTYNCEKEIGDRDDQRVGKRTNEEEESPKGALDGECGKGEDGFNF